MEQFSEKDEKYGEIKKVTPSYGKNGYPETNVKTDGIEIRGCKNTQRGTKARGPMG